MKSTKAMHIEGMGCLVQVSTQQRNQDGSYAVAEALTWVPGMGVLGMYGDKVTFGHKTMDVKPGKVINRILLRDGSGSQLVEVQTFSGRADESLKLHSEGLVKQATTDDPPATMDLWDKTEKAFFDASIESVDKAVDKVTDQIERQNQGAMDAADSAPAEVKKEEDAQPCPSSETPEPEPEPAKPKPKPKKSTKKGKKKEE
jgi:hypothetical protein